MTPSPPPVTFHASLATQSVTESELKKEQKRGPSLGESVRALPPAKRALVFQLLAWLSNDHTPSAHEAWTHLFSLKNNTAFVHEMIMEHASDVMCQQLLVLDTTSCQDVRKGLSSFYRTLLKKVQEDSAAKRDIRLERLEAFWIRAIPALSQMLTLHSKKEDALEACLHTLLSVKDVLLKSILPQPKEYQHHSILIHNYGNLVIGTLTVQKGSFPSTLWSHIDLLQAFNGEGPLDRNLCFPLIEEALLHETHNAEHALKEEVWQPFCLSEEDSAVACALFRCAPQRLNTRSEHVQVSVEGVPSRLEVYASNALYGLAKNMPEGDNVVSHTQRERRTDLGPALQRTLAYLTQCWERTPQRRLALCSSFHETLDALKSHSWAKKPLLAWYRATVMPWIASQEGGQGQALLFRALVYHQVRLIKPHPLTSSHYSPLEDLWYNLERTKAHPLPYEEALSLAVHAIQILMYKEKSGYPTRLLQKLSRGWEPAQQQAWSALVHTWRRQICVKGRPPASILENLKDKACLARLLPTEDGGEGKPRRHRL